MNVLLLIALITASSLGTIDCALKISKEDDAAFATILQGKLRGTILQSRNSRNYYAFRGIPYAKVNGRFQAPLPADFWEDVKNATQFGPECPQTVHFTGEVVVDTEDCLFLNVYVPELENFEKELPIMVWIHGGGFWEGAGSHYGADFFMDEDVILVTFNYRLGVLGFLNTGDGLVPGNNGLRDMIEALKWVQGNIQSFHGDSNRVTIFGESAGGFAVHYLTLSPAAKGLFQGAISQSGTALSPLGFVENPAKSNKLLADQLDCPSSPTEKMLDCFKSQELGALLSAQKNITFLGPDYINNRFAPSLDSNLPGDGSEDNRIVPATPYELMRNRLTPSVPFIVGLAESEGLMGFAGMTQKLMDNLNKNWLDISAERFGYKDFVPEEELKPFGTELRQIYMDNQDFSLDTEDSFVDMHSHYIMYRGTRLTAELTAQQSSQVYPYVFTHRGGFFSFANYLGLYGRGPTHADDLQYQFPSLTKYKSWPDLFHEMDIEFSKKFVKLWVSFAASGKPTETWGMDWEAANVTNQHLGTELPWYSIHQRPKLFKFSQEYEDKFVKMDTLYSKYEKPQRSWRASKNVKRDEL